MKTQKKTAQGSKRWKWMAGAAAATAAGATASRASAITINLVGNYISATGGNHLNADLTGDGHPDLTITGAFHFTVPHGSSGYGNKSYVGVALNGVGAQAFVSNDWYFGTVRLGSKVGYFLRDGSLRICYANTVCKCRNRADYLGNGQGAIRNPRIDSSRGYASRSKTRSGMPFHSVASYRQIIVCEWLILALAGSFTRWLSPRAKENSAD